MMESFLRRFARNQLALLGLFILAGVLVLVLAAPLIYPGDPFRLSGPPLQPPFGRFVLGTDTLGRDVAAGIVYGARTTVLIGLCATGGAILFGTLIGGLAGFYRGWIDIILMRVTEFFQTIPAFVFAILLVSMLSPSVGSEIIAVAAVSWPGIARLVRSQFASLGGREFVIACVGLGASDSRIILRHLLPNCLSSITVVGALLIATSILIESGLSFLGLGDPNVMSWGLMISAGRGVLRSAWWVCTFPGIAILLTVLAINLVSDGINEAMNPRLRQR
jgi:peptide/nickel transport system permease protein